MAKSPQKSDDPMADTLNAIEAALKLGEGQRPRREVPSEKVTAPTRHRVPKPKNSYIFDEPPQPTWQADDDAAAPRQR